MTSFSSLRGRLRLAALFVSTCAASYAFGVYSHQHDVWPIGPLRVLLTGAEVPVTDAGIHDAFGRLVSFPGKTEVPCPGQTADTAVILAIGQSNAANHAAARLATHHPGQVLNLFDGKCFAAASPLLGATGEGGEFLTPLADRLVDDGAYKTVIIVASAITDTPISRWQRDGDLNDMLMETLKPLLATYKITDVVWHQGENDLRFGTPGKVYQASFRSLLDTLREAGIDAPVFIAVASACGTSRLNGNAIAEGQRALVDNRTIFLGADTDALLDDSDRKNDRCHLSESGQKKTALSYAAAIEKVRRGS
jgi:hypothetical protein